MNSLASTMYHSVLRVAGLVVACVLMVDGGLLSSVTADMSARAGYFVANSVGVSVGVAPNEINQLTSALSEYEQQLQARESQIREREIEIGLSSGEAAGPDRSTFIIAALLFIILVLIILNYVLDFIRAREYRSFPA